MDSQTRMYVVGLLAATISYVLAVLAIGGELSVLGVAVFVVVFPVGVFVFERVSRWVEALGSD